MNAEAILGVAVTLAMAGVSGVVWLVRLEGRINNEQSLRESQLKNLVERSTSFEARIYEMLKDIQESLREKADK